MTLRKRVTCYVVFQGAEHRRPWRIFCKRGWRHVTLLVPAYDPYPSLTAKESTQVIQFWTDQARADVVWEPVRKVADQWLADGATCVISFPIDQRFTGRYVPRGLMTCVSLTKYFLSIDAWYIVNPYQLARYLLRNGGTLLTKKDAGIDLIVQQTESGQESSAGADAGAERAVHADQQAGGR